MNIQNEIIDYEKNKDEIEKWLFLKGEDKYYRFLLIVKEAGIETTWKNISNLYRYDKRLLINCFKYFSFFEEYIRAILLRENPEETYEKLNDSHTDFSYQKKELLKMNSERIKKYFHTEKIEANLESIRNLRNDIAHNKIIIKGDYKHFISDFHDLLPKDYQPGFVKDILSCEKNLTVPKDIRIDIETFSKYTQ